MKESNKAWAARVPKETLKKGFPTEAEFRAWWESELNAGRGDVHASGGRRLTTCPVARYLRGNGYPDAAVGILDWAPYGTSDARDRKLPFWAVHWIQEADEMMP